MNILIEMISTLLFTFSKKPTKLSFSRSVSEDNGGKVTGWLHSLVKTLCSVIKSEMFSSTLASLLTEFCRIC